MINMTKRCYAIILAMIILLSSIPFTGILAKAAGIPADNLTVVEKVSDAIQVTGRPVEEGTGFIMSDGSVAICTQHLVPAPAVGATYTIDKNLGTTYEDPGIGTVSTDWTFRCLYYAEKLEREGTVNFITTLRRIYIAETAARRQYYDTLPWHDSAPYTKMIHDLYNAVVAAADADVDQISGKLQYADGVATYVAADGHSTRLALYQANTAGVQRLLVYTPGIPLATGHANLVKTSSNTTITDGNSCYSLAGAKYDVFSDPQTNHYVGSLITDEWGNTNTLELNAGTYYVKEVAAPMGYALDTTVHTITVTSGETTTLNVQDIPQSDPVGILLRKQDDDTGDTKLTADASLQGAEFTIKYFSGLYDTNPEEQGITPTRQWTVKTNKDGYAYLSEEYKVSGDAFYYNSIKLETLPLGTVTIQETKAPEGYFINPEVFVRQITSDGTVESVSTYNEPIIKEQIKGGTISLINFTNDGQDTSNFQIPEQGAEFQIYLKSAGSYEAAVATGDIRIYDSGVVDATGNVIWNNQTSTSKELAYGTYIVHQVSGWEGRKLADDFEVEIKEDTPTNHPFVLKNPIFQTTLTVNKYDAETGQLIVQTPAKFKILNLQTNEYVSYTTVYPTVQTIDEFETTNGTFTLPVPLTYGKYSLIETQAPEGYYLNNQPITFSVDGTSKDNTIIDVKNTPLKGKIELFKTGLQFTKIETQQTEYGTVNKPVFENTYLAGTTWNILAAEDIISGDGSILYKKGDIVDTLTTLNNGAVSSKELPLGNYSLIETATAPGYQLDTKVYPVTVSNDGTQQVSVISVTANNEKINTEINLLKSATVWEVLEYDNIISRQLTEAPGEGFTFGLYANQSFTTIDGKQTITQDSLVAFMVTDKEGKITFTDDVPLGFYYVKELAAPEPNYNLSEEKYDVDLTTTETNLQTIVVYVTDEAILNDFDKFEIMITKTDLTNSQPVANALVSIKDVNGNIVYRVYTGEDGILPDIILEPGDYTFEEIVAPKGYIRNQTVFTFTVNPDGTVDGITEFTNEPTNVTITKTDLTTAKTIPGAEIVIYDEHNNEVFRDITDENGQISAMYLEIGKIYTFKETIAPNGYAINTSTFTFEIDENGNVIGDTNITDDITKLTIHKIGDQNQVLPGVEFTMYDTDGNVLSTVITDENGLAVFSGFEKGEYTIRETKTIDGFTLSTDSISVIHDNDQWDNDSDKAHITVINYPHVDIPQTGDNSYHMMAVIFIVSGLSLVIAFVIGKRQITKRKKK